jgi:hypothetical protein
MAKESWERYLEFWEPLILSALAWLRTVVLTLYPRERNALRTWAATKPEPPVIRTVSTFSPDSGLVLPLSVWWILDLKGSILASVNFNLAIDVRRI